MTSVVIDYKTGKINGIILQINYIKYINVMYTFLKKSVSKIVFFYVAVYTMCKI
jgi:hypothetical protein